MANEFDENQGVLNCSMEELPSVRLALVSDEGDRQVWKGLIERYHYLGVKQPTGRQLRYVVYAGEQPIGALGWKGGSLTLVARDCFIGWDVQQRRAYLDHVVNNYRFVLVDWLRVANLASHVLARGVRELCRDWQARYGVVPWLLETFVDRSRFSGTTYRAAGWRAVGNSSGYGKYREQYRWHGEPKEIYLYVVQKNFRTLIGCTQRPVPKVSEAAKIREGRLLMMIQNAAYDPQLINWTEIDTATKQDLATEIVTFHHLFHDCFCRSELRQLGEAYLCGLISDLQRKNIESIALAFVGQTRVRSMQYFLSRYGWDDAKALSRSNQLLFECIGEQEGMWSVDSTEIPKKGKESVGVARQYCGARGKTENCQSGVFASFTSEVGYGLLEGRLYLPQLWFSHEYERRRQACHIPKDVQFATKIQIAIELLRHHQQRGIFHAGWVGCDSFFGVDVSFRDEVATMGKTYLAAIKPQSKIWLNGRACSAAELATDSSLDWRQVTLAEGAKGPIVAQVATIRVSDNRDEKPGVKQWLILRRLQDGRLKYYLSNASAQVEQRVLWSALVRRWPIEQCFEDGKKHLGMDHYENRTWNGWHRHMLYVMLAMLFLLRLRLRYIKNSHADAAPDPAAAGGVSGTPAAG